MGSTLSRFWGSHSVHPCSPDFWLSNVYEFLLGEYFLNLLEALCLTDLGLLVVLVGLSARIGEVIVIPIVTKAVAITGITLSV